MKKTITALLLSCFSIFVLIAQDPARPPSPPTFAKDYTLFDGGVEETQPFFPGCTDWQYETKKKCSEAKMLEFVASNIHYPPKARRKRITGMVYTRFVVEKDGSFSNFETLQDIGGGCGKEVIRMLKTMPKWEPATQRGKPVRVRYTLPVRFHTD